MIEKKNCRQRSRFGLNANQNHGFVPTVRTGATATIDSPSASVLYPEGATASPSQGPSMMKIRLNGLEFTAGTNQSARDFIGSGCR